MYLHLFTLFADGAKAEVPEFQKYALALSISNWFSIEKYWHITVALFNTCSHDISSSSFQKGLGGDTVAALLFHLKYNVTTIMLLNIYTGCPKKCVFRILRAMKGGQNFGPLWAIQVLSEGLGHLGPFWATLCIFGPLQLFGPLWAILGHFGHFWAT